MSEPSLYDLLGGYNGVAAFVKSALAQGVEIQDPDPSSEEYLELLQVRM